MITYTVRDATDRPLQRCTDLAAAVAAVDGECEAHTHHPATRPGDRIHRIVTADIDADDVGDVVYGRIECAGDRTEHDPCGAGLLPPNRRRGRGRLDLPACPDAQHTPVPPSHLSAQRPARPLTGTAQESPCQGVPGRYPWWRARYRPA